MLVSTAYAQTAGAAAGGTDYLIQFAPILAIMVVFYFLLLRPQQKKAKDHKNMLEALRKGDRVVTGGGILGTVVKVTGDEMLVEISEGVRVRVIRSTVTQVLAKTAPANDQPDTEEDEGDAAGDESGEGSTLPGMAKPQRRRPTGRK
jgi:preprotein translocase subunit YajC